MRKLLEKISQPTKFVNTFSKNQSLLTFANQSLLTLLSLGGGRGRHCKCDIAFISYIILISSNLPFRQNIGSYCLFLFCQNKYFQTKSVVRLPRPSVMAFNQRFWTNHLRKQFNDSLIMNRWMNDMIRCFVSEWTLWVNEFSTLKWINWINYSNDSLRKMYRTLLA